MRRPWSVAVLLALAALAGYAAGARPVQAQVDPFPFRLGETVELGFDESRGRKCRVEEIRSPFIRCRNLSPSDRTTRWLNLTQVQWVTAAAAGGADQNRR